MACPFKEVEGHEDDDEDDDDDTLEKVPVGARRSRVPALKKAEVKGTVGQATVPKALEEAATVDARASKVVTGAVAEDLFNPERRKLDRLQETFPEAVSKGEGIPAEVLEGAFKAGATRSPAIARAEVREGTFMAGAEEVTADAFQSARVEARTRTRGIPDVLPFLPLLPATMLQSMYRTWRAGLRVGEIGPRLQVQGKAMQQQSLASRTNGRGFPFREPVETPMRREPMKRFRSIPKLKGGAFGGLMRNWAEIIKQITGK